MPHDSGGVYLHVGTDVHAITGFATGLLLGQPATVHSGLEAVGGLSPVPGRFLDGGKSLEYG